MTHRQKLIPLVILRLAQVYLLTFPFGQIFRFTFFRPDIHLYPADILVGLTSTVSITWICVRHLLRDRTPLNIVGRHSLPLLGFITWAAVSLLLNSSSLTFGELATSALYWLRLVGYALFFMAIYQSLKTLAQEISQLAQTLILSGTLFVLFSFLQYFFLPSLYPLHRAGWDPHYYRLVGTLLDPGFTGIILVIFFFFLLSYKNTILRQVVFNPAISQKTFFGKAWSQLARKSLPSQIWPRASGEPKKTAKSIPSIACYLLLIVTFVAIFLTYSRASYLALLTSLATTFWAQSTAAKDFKAKNLLKIFILSFTGLVLLIVFLPKPSGEGGNLARTSTINFRLANYQSALKIFRDHPLVGVGFNAYRYAQARYQFTPSAYQLTSHSAAGADNSFLFLLATTGIIGGFLFLWLIVDLAKHLWSILPHSPLGLSAFSAFVALLIHSQFHHTLFYPWVMGYLAVVLALAFSKKEKQKKRKTCKPPRDSTAQTAPSTPFPSHFPPHLSL